MTGATITVTQRHSISERRNPSHCECARSAGGRSPLGAGQGTESPACQSRSRCHRGGGNVAMLMGDGTDGRGSEGSPRCQCRA